MERINNRLVPPSSGDWRFRLLPTALLEDMAWIIDTLKLDIAN
jgi:hypothetical protein